MSIRIQCELFVQGRGAERVEWRLEGQGPWAVGRFGCDVEIVHPSISRRHFLMTSVGPDSVFVKRLSQTNDLRIGAESIQSGPWKIGETLYFGSCAVRLVETQVQALSPAQALKRPSESRSSSRTSSSLKLGNLSPKALSPQTTRRLMLGLLVGLMVFASASLWMLRKNQKRVEGLSELQSAAAPAFVEPFDCATARRAWKKELEEGQQSPESLEALLGKVRDSKRLEEEVFAKRERYSEFLQDPAYQEAMFQLGVHLERLAAREKCLDEYVREGI
jgi:hypothetical protein